MAKDTFIQLHSELAALEPVRHVGRVADAEGGVLRVRGLTSIARLGDQLRILMKTGGDIGAEVIALKENGILALPEGGTEGIGLEDAVVHYGSLEIAPDDSWIGRVIDPFGRPLDGTPILRGPRPRSIIADPPNPTERRSFGTRLETGMAAFDTVLPLAAGQRIGLFAGSGVGKSSLLGRFAQRVEADVVVLALIGERGREVSEFIERILGPEGMRRTIVIAATSDQAPQTRRRAAWTAMAVAEHFRDEGLNVLLMADSITRFAEAHREVAVAAGETPSLRGYPASTSHMIMSLCERAGTGAGSAGNITAVFTVLVAGSDMEGPIADIMRGVLDGHVVMDREIAERGRYPAIDLLRSVSRSLPDAATEDENAAIAEARQLLGAYDRAEMMVQAGLYQSGSDPLLDRAIAVWPALDAFLAESSPEGSIAAFEKLQNCLNRQVRMASPRVPAG